MPKKRKSNVQGSSENNKRQKQNVENLEVSNQDLEDNSEPVEIDGAELDNNIEMIESESNEIEQVQEEKENAKKQDNKISERSDKKYRLKEEDKIREIDTSKWNLSGKLKGSLVFKRLNGIESIIFDKKTIKELKKIEFIDLPDLERIKFNLGFQNANEINGIDSIKLTNLTNLKTFLANHCKLKKIEIENCPEIIDFRVGNNFLSDISFLNSLNEKKLKLLSIHSNKLGKGKELSLDCFGKFEKLESLFIDNLDKNKIKEGDCNHFAGSLEPLQDLKDLKELSINNTDIDHEEGELRGLLDSLESLETISCSSSERSGSKVRNLADKLKDLSKKNESWNFDEKTDKFNLGKIKEWKDICLELQEEQWKEKEFDLQQTKEWIKAGLNPKDAGLADYLKKKGYDAEFWKSPFNEDEKKKVENRYKFQQWKDKDAEKWLDNEYQEDGNCRGEFDKDNRGKKREEIEELDISDEGLEGNLKFKGFSKLKYLVCRNNQLTGIDISECYSSLLSLDCGKNKLKKLEFADNKSGLKLEKLKEFRGSNNKFMDIKDIIDKINHENLTYLDVSNNEFSADLDIDVLKKFTKLQSLYINNNKLKGSLSSLKESKGIVDIDIRGTSIEINSLDELPEGLEEIYCDKEQLKKLKEEQKKYYKEGDGFYDLKALRDKKQKKIKIDKILKIPALTASRKEKYSVKRVREDYDIENYYKDKSVIYPSEEETKFSWEINEQLPVSKLPLRLCYINGEIDKDKKSKKIEIKKRIECADDAKYYAILSYSWGGDPRRDVEWSFKNAEDKLSQGGKKALSKAIETLKTLEKSHGLNINYFWMDQLCINQNDDKEKGHEIPRMRDYYGNGIVTLIPINADIGEQTIRRLMDSFERGEGKFLYPNKIIKNSLPVLEKIIGSEWFSRSWTFQEGFLSKRTIFMFDDFLVDGRFLALVWKLAQVSEVSYEECKEIKELCKEKAATPLGWAYYEEEKKGYNIRDKVALRLNEALWAVKRRERSIPLDGIYSIIGLLYYGRKIEVDYGKDPESVLREAMFIATKYGDGDPLCWYGIGSRTPGLCWLPEMDEISGSSSITGVIHINCDKSENFLDFKQGRGIKLLASEYVISDTEKSRGVYSLDREEIVDGGLWMRNIWVKKDGNSEEEALTLSGTKVGMKAANRGRVLLIPNKKMWKSDGKQFAILALRIENKNTEALKTIQEYLKEKEKVKRISLIGKEELAITKELLDTTSAGQKDRPEQVTKIIQISKAESDQERFRQLQEVKNFLQEQVNKSISKDDIQDNLRHRIDLVRIEESGEELKKHLEEKEVAEKTFIIGLDNQEMPQQYQAQIEIPPKK